MPLPLFLGVGAAVGAAVGVGSGIHGAVKAKQAGETMKTANDRHQGNISRFEERNTATSSSMDAVGKLELEILDSFATFSNLIEKIQNKPQFKTYSKEGFTLPEYNPEELKKVSVGAGALLGSLGGAALGTAGGFAAAGATTSAVMALGTASTGTAIATLHGVALTNATLAALGGGSLAAGGGGMALGSTILGATTLGAGILVGGIIFNITGTKLSKKADEAWAQMKKAEEKIDKICRYLGELNTVAVRYKKSLDSVNEVYQKHLAGLSTIVELLGKKDWNEFTDAEKKLTENTVLLVGLLYNMCKVELVLKNENANGVNSVNITEAKKAMEGAESVLADIA